MANSTLATISVAGMLVGVIAKFNPFLVMKLLKLGFPRSKSKTADQPQSGPVREQQLIVRIITTIEMHQKLRIN